MTEDTAAERWYLAAFPSGTSSRTANELFKSQGEDSPEVWISLAENLYHDGLVQAGSIPALEAALKLYPGNLDLIRALASSEYGAGEEAAARARLAPLIESDAAAAVMVLRFDRRLGRMDRADLMRAADLVLNTFPWGAVHEEFIQLCRDGDHHDLGAQFLSAWLSHRGLDSQWPLIRGGELLLEAGELAQAVPMLLGIWEYSETVCSLIGKWTGIPDDDADTEARILDEIEHAFAIPEEDISVYPLPDCSRDPATVTVFYLGGQLTGTGVNASNDLANHFGAAAAAAGGRFIPWLDSTLVSTSIPPCSDEEIRRRKQAFLDELERVRPDIFLCDSQSAPGVRFPSVAEITELKARLGFKLVYVLRDPLSEMDRHIRVWATVADRIVTFDPCAYMLRDSEHEALGAKTFVIPVPAMHPPFVPATAPPSRQLLFIGSTYAPHRSFLLAGLASADIGLEMIIGGNRRRLAPDPQSFAELLATSRAVLNISAHAPGETGRLVTGRVWETIAAGSVLIEQLHEGTARFLMPWRHFIPWSEPADIIRRWRVLSRHEDLRARIAAEAHAWAQRHYSADKVWRAILAHTLD